MTNETHNGRGAPAIILGGVVGIALIVAGVGVAVARSQLWNVWVVALVLAGFVVLTLLLGYNRTRALHMAPGTRRVLYGYNVFLTAALLVGILLIVNVMVARYGREPIDVSASGRYTLSDRTVQVLGDVKRNVTVTVLLPRLSDPGARLDQLLSLYQLKNDLVTVEFVDPYARKLEMQRLKKKYGEIEPGGVLVEYGERHKFIGFDEIFVAEIEGGMFRPERLERTTFKGEDALTSVINALLEGKKSIIYFTTGHGEKSIDNASKEDTEGIGLIKQELERLNNQAKKLDLVQADRVPDDCKVLVVCGPKKPFSPAEVTKVSDYLERGTDSKLILCVDPMVQTGLEEKLKRFKVDIQDDIVVDLQWRHEQGATILLPLVTNPQHEVVRDLMLQRLVMIEARSIDTVQDYPPPEAGGPPGGQPQQFEAVALVTSSPRSWGEVDYKDKKAELNQGRDHLGPVNLAVAVTQYDPPLPPRHPMMMQPPPNSKRYPRLVVFGDSEFVANPYLEAGANVDLFLNAVSWLRGRTELIGIKSEEQKPLTLSVTTSERWNMLLLPSLAMLLVLLVGGAAMWVIRTRY